MTTYIIDGHSVSADAPDLQALLAAAHKSKARPLCMCRDPGVEMYVANVDGRYIVKRMPNSGGGHAPECDSYEPPAELSGLGEVLGSAIVEQPEDGTTMLKFDFSMSRNGSRPVPQASGAESDSVRTDGNKLTIRGLLHFLWDQAGFCKWTPSMEGKRNWYVIRKYLMQAAEGKVAKGSSLANMLYMPENYSLEKKAEIAQRRLAKLMQISAMEKGARRLMLVVGEVKGIEKGRLGHMIVLKHLPDYHFMLNDDLHKRLLKRFEVELGLWDAVEGTHMIMVGTFGVNIANGVATLEEVSLMPVTENWVPYESVFEKMLLDDLTDHKRRFVKGMRYNLPSSKPLASVVLSDTAPEPTAMYVVPPGASDEYADALDQLVDESKLPAWVWRAGTEGMPDLPQR